MPPKKAISGVVLAMALGMAASPVIPQANALPGTPASHTQGVPIELRVPSDFDPSDYKAQGERLVVEQPTADLILTLSPRLQGQLESLLEQYEVPAAGVVVMEPNTGKILAYVNHQREPLARDLVRSAHAPAASVFKIVTAAALLDRGISPATRICYGGGFQRLTASDLEDNPERDRSCATLADAMGQSINTVFAKLAVRHLDVSKLSRYASAFGFGHQMPFDVPVEPSAIDIPAEQLEFARTAAGFWHSYLSPLHGALMAATVANAGQMPRAYIVQSMRYPCGEFLVPREGKAFRSVISESTARVLSNMMQRTVSSGTSFRAFHDAKGQAFLPDTAVAGKTGSLSASDPYRSYSWWVGFAPADAPRIVVSALVINKPSWRIKASFVAREAIRFAMQAPSKTVALR